MGLVTIRLKDNDTLFCDALENFDFALNSEKEEVEVYRHNQFLGYYNGIWGISEESLLDYIRNCWEQENNRVQ